MFAHGLSVFLQGLGYVFLFLLWTILAVLIFVLIVIVLILFVPIKVNVEVLYDNSIENSDNSKNLDSGDDKKSFINTFLEISWLFKFFQFKLKMNNDENVQEVKVLGFLLKKSEIDTVKIKDELEEIKEEFKEEIEEEFEKDIEVEANEEQEEASQENSKTNLFNNIKKIIKSTKSKCVDFVETIKLIVSKIDFFLNHKDKDFIIKETKVLLKRIKKGLKIDSFEITGRVGFADPSTTGMFMAIESFIIGLMDLNIRVKGDFGNYEKDEIKVLANMKFKLVLNKFIFPILRFALKKPIKIHISNFLKTIKHDEN